MIDVEWCSYMNQVKWAGMMIAVKKSYIYIDTMADVKGTIKNMIEKGQDPKDYLIEVCRPQCQGLLDKLRRCENKLKNMTNADPELSCMYPFRDWVTCVDGCVKMS